MKLATFTLLALGACTADEPTGPEPVTTGEFHHYATSALRIPVSGELQREYGLDVDGDPAGRPDNQLGNVFVALTSNSDADVQAQIDSAVTTGSVVLLHSVRADDLGSDRSVSWQVYGGAATGAPPAFDGSDTFTLGDGVSSPILGRTTAGYYDATTQGAGAITVRLQISEAAPPLELDLIAARVEATIDDTGCSGRLGGAVTMAQIDQELIPSVVTMMNAAIARDPGCPEACEAGTSAALIVSVFDEDMDGMVTETEIKGSSIIQTLLSPDLDLLDASGAFAPDDEADSISLGVGFECVAASFTVPGEP